MLPTWRCFVLRKKITRKTPANRSVKGCAISACPTWVLWSATLCLALLNRTAYKRTLLIWRGSLFRKVKCHAKYSEQKLFKVPDRSWYLLWKWAGGGNRCPLSGIVIVRIVVHSALIELFNTSSGIVLHSAENFTKSMPGVEAEWKAFWISRYFIQNSISFRVVC